MEELKELINQYKAFEFDYAKCGSIAPAKISGNDEIIYEERPKKEQLIQQSSREEFEKLSNLMMSRFSDKYYHRFIPKNMIGADRIARFISQDDSYLFDFYYEICEAAIAKNDVPTLTYIMQIMELPMYYLDPIKTNLMVMCSQMLPKLTLSCNHDTSVYIQNIRSHYCVLGVKVDELRKAYDEGLLKEKVSLIKSLPHQKTFGEE